MDDNWRYPHDFGNFHISPNYPLVNSHIANWKITMFNGTINYFYGPFSIANR
jgi:hypothetical protein